MELDGLGDYLELGIIVKSCMTCKVFNRSLEA